MARIAGVDIPKNKRGVISLTYIYGIGRSRAEEILSTAKVDESIKVQDWTDDQISGIREAVGTFTIEGELRSETQLNIKRLMDIGCYRGIRHRSGIPLRGNNIIISLTNKKGDVISWSSAGKMGFRGSKKNTPYAAQLAAEDAAAVAQEAGLKKVKVYVKGPGNGRESAIRSIHNAGIEVTEIIDVTPLPHNGCRPPKRRRV